MALAAALLGGLGVALRGSPSLPVGFGAHSVTLDGPNPLTLTQGDGYTEHGVSLSPAAVAHVETGLGAAPMVSFEYSSPSLAFSNSVGEVGTFEVTYSVEAPWLGSEGAVQLSRTVVVQDVNECTYTGPVDALKHTCAEGTTCANTVGSFTCN